MHQYISMFHIMVREQYSFRLAYRESDVEALSEHRITATLFNFFSSLVIRVHFCIFVVCNRCTLAVCRNDNYRKTSKMLRTSIRPELLRCFILNFPEWVTSPIVMKCTSSFIVFEVINERKIMKANAMKKISNRERGNMEIFT